MVTVYGSSWHYSVNFEIIFSINQRILCGMYMHTHTDAYTPSGKCKLKLWRDYTIQAQKWLKLKRPNVGRMWGFCYWKCDIYTCHWTAFQVHKEQADSLNLLYPRNKFADALPRESFQDSAAGNTETVYLGEKCALRKRFRIRRICLRVRVFVWVSSVPRR